MSFKVGDRVVVILRGYEGLEGVIKSVYFGDSWIVDFPILVAGRHPLAFLSKQLRLLEITPFERDVRAYIDRELGG